MSPFHVASLRRYVRWRFVLEGWERSCLTAVDALSYTVAEVRRFAVQEFIAARRDEIAELSRRHHVRSLSVFGSAIREDFDPQRSDVDLIVEFEEFPMEQYLDNKRSLRAELAAELGREVDLLTWKSLKNPVIRREVESNRLMLYAA